MGTEWPSGKVVMLRLPKHYLGQLLDGADILIEEWEYTADYLEHGTVRSDMLIRECSDADEARWIAGFYREIVSSIRRQLARQR